MTTQAELNEPDAVEEHTEPSLLLRFGAELVGTFLLVLAIVMVAAIGGVGTDAVVLYVAAAAGLALTGLVVVFGRVSGAHLNPAVSLAAAVSGRLAWIDLVPYIVAQLLGGIGAGALVRALVPSGLAEGVGATDAAGVISRAANGFGQNTPLFELSQGAVRVSTTQALLIEVVATALFVGVVIGATRKPSPTAPVAIGGALTVAILMAGMLTNAAINPARATATAFFAEPWALQQLWLFWVAPLIGGLIVGLVAITFGPQPVEEGWDDEYDDADPEAEAEQPDQAWYDEDHVQVIDTDGEIVHETDPDAVEQSADETHGAAADEAAELSPADTEAPDEEPERPGSKSS